MAKIDRLGWAAGMCFTAYGLRIGIRVTNPEVLDRLPALLPPGWKPATSAIVDRLYSFVVGSVGPRANVRRFNLLYVGPARLGRTLELDEILHLLESDLYPYVAESARRRLFVHAGVVGWRGRAIVIPGRSFSGKSTLVAALVRAGAIYYSDEYAVFDAHGRVHPFSQPLSVRDETGNVLGKVSAEALGGGPGVKPLPVGLVVSTQYKLGARWRPRALSPGRAVLALLAHTVSARQRPQRALAILLPAVSQALGLKGTRGEAGEMVDTLLHACVSER